MALLHRNSKKSTELDLNKGAFAGTSMSLANRLMDVGIDGKGRFDSAADVAQRALQESGGDVDAAIDKVIADHRRLAAAGGFVTGLGGFVTMTVSLPANIAGFYALATRMTAAIAHLRGYDLRNRDLRSAILLALVGGEADALLKKAGVVSTGRLANLATRGLPPAARMVIDKAVGFRLIAQVSEKLLPRLGKSIPLAGGVVGAGLDVYLLNKVAKTARTQFPAPEPGAPGTLSARA
ncbi:EcsC family protein [Allobranchiibius sp. CTAmp26]|uniref:EcsC family protein n=1 Tax=Allobranchiibius sp. CTAmp26 TaxID=2815214 RepID=UPI0027DDF013|nr:EcsC family protein [Allobranchiibius sp. CTAmp26]